MKSLTEIYDAEWVAHDFAELQPEFNVAARAIVAVFGKLVPPFGALMVFDVGCGPGMLVRGLRDAGAEAWGLDGSRACLDYAAKDIRARLIQEDIRSPGLVLAPAALGISGLTTPPYYDVVTCTEVAEHIEEEHAGDLVDVVTSARAPWIVWTAAPPGQEGNHHVNCQPPAYWARLFLPHGYAPVANETVLLREAWAPLERLAHMTRNLVVYAREGAVAR